MQMSSLLFVALYLGVSAGISRTLVPSRTAADDEVTNLPGLTASIDFKHFAGYVDLPGTYKHLFYWFVEASGGSDENTPLVLWSNGGPGCSGLLGFLSEHGPFRPTANLSISLDEFAWNKRAHMLYIEAPVSVGFSYSDDPSDYVIGDNQTAADNYAMILGFLKKHPEHAKRPFYISSESYGGHYIPTLAKTILDNNDGTINFKGFAVGNPLTNPIENAIGMYDAFYARSMITKPTHDGWTARCRDGQQTHECEVIDNLVAAEIGNPNPYALDYPVCNSNSGAAAGRAQRTWLAHYLHSKSSAAKREKLGIIMPADYQPCEMDFLTKYLNMPSVQTAIHARNTTWGPCSNVLYYNQTDVDQDMVPIYKELLENGSIKMLVFSGDDDSVCGTLGTQEWVWDLAQVKTPWAPWMFNDTRYGMQQGGYVVKFDGLSFATVHGAGHEVPAYRPQSALEMFTKFLDGSLF